MSVVIACYQGADTLGLQLESLVEQVNAPAFEVLVVDNGSLDPPDDVVAQWADRLNVRVLPAVRWQGVAYARNVGLREARADRVVFCDADDVTGEQFLAAADSALDHAPFITGNVCTFGAEEFDAGVVGIRELLRSHPSQVAQDLEPVDLNYPVFMGGASAVRRDAALALFGFDQSYVPGAEDNDFGLRALDAGYPVLRSSGMCLAERRRATPSGILKRSYAGGRMHMRLCAGHDLWGVSPHLHNPEWWADLARLPLVSLRVVRHPTDSEMRLGFAGRVGLRCGQFVGFMTYRVLRRPVRPRLGLGLTEV